MGRIKELFFAFRPKTLTASLVPCCLSISLVHAEKIPVQWNLFFWALASSFAIQIGTNLINDAMDFKKGADADLRTGPRRITQAGVFSHRSVLIFGSLCFLIAFLCGIPLVLEGGFPIVVIGLTSILMGYAYTSGPYPLAYKGLGDLFVFIFFGLVAVGGLYYLQTQILSVSALILGAQVGLLGTVLIAINNARDIEGDRLANKWTLAARFGLQFARWEVIFLINATFILNFYWLFSLNWQVAAWPLLSLPIAFILLKGFLSHPPGAIYNKYLAQSALLQIVFGALLCLGMWWGK